MYINGATDDLTRKSRESQYFFSIRCIRTITVVHPPPENSQCIILVPIVICNAVTFVHVYGLRSHQKQS